MQVVDFIVNYWQYLSIALVVLIEIVILIIKRHPKKYDDFVQVVEQAFVHVPSIISAAEEVYTASGEGVQKMEFVLFEILNFIEGRLHRDVNEKECDYIYKTFSQFIEAILDAPTKKGGCGREED